MDKRDTRPMSCAVLAISAVFLSGSGAGHLAVAQDFPTQEIQMIVPWPAGGSTDQIGRLVASGAEKHLDVPIVVINRPGAGGAEGTHAVMEAEADGYTIGINGPGLVARPYTLPDHPDLDDLQPIVWIGGDPLAIAVRADAPWKTLGEFLDEARTNPVQLSGLQPGSAFYTATLIFENEFDVEFSKIPYAGFAQMGPALQAGEIDAGVALLTDWLPFVEDGAARILAVMDDERHFLAPDVPTVEEAVGQAFEQTLWRTIFARAGIPEERVKVLEEAFLAGMQEPDIKERARSAGWVIDPAGSAEARERWKAADEEIYPVLQELDMVVSPRD
jgi:tripartite-type tricarboxylate transporter receptor subunit TctC